MSTCTEGVFVADQAYPGQAHLVAAGESWLLERTRILLLVFFPFVFECRGSLSHLKVTSETICRRGLLETADHACGVFFSELVCGFCHYLISLPHKA